MSTVETNNDLVYFTSITPIIDAQPGKVDAHQFKLKWSFDSAISYIDFTKFEIYRYIGKANTCVSNITETDPQCKLIYRVSKLSETSSRVERIRPAPLFNTSVVQNNHIKAFSSLTDDLSIWYARASESLINYHKITDSLHDEQLLQQIYTSERTIYYLIKTYIKNTFDTSPYCIGAHHRTQIVDCTSTKNQVKHDTLHYEGDYIWETDCSAKIPLAGGNGMSRTAVDTSRIYVDLEHQGPTGRGGYCWVSDRGSTKCTVARFNLSNGLNTGMWYSSGNTINGGAIGVRIKDGACYNGTRNSPAGNDAKGYIYLINNPRALPEFAVGTTPSIVATNVGIVYGAVNVAANNTDKIIFNVRGGSAPGIYITSNEKIESLYSYNGTYGIAAGPNGDIYNGFAHSGGNNQGQINRNGVKWANGGTATSVTTNNPRNTSNYTVYFGGDNGGSSNGLWYKTLNGNTTQIYAGDQARGFGVDGENNIWGLGKKRLKIYHVNGDSAGENSNIYPYGLSARYPSYTLKYARSSETNTKWVEWFLTRNNFNLDDKIKLAWMDPITQEILSLTAKAAWSRLVDSRRKEDNSGYFKVWLSPYSSTQYSTHSKLYGIKLKHLVDIEQYSRDQQKVKYDEAYSLIKLWSDLYADAESTLCYPDLLNDTTTRNTVINGNLLGRRLHPNYNSETYIVDRLSNNTKITVNNFFESRSIADSNRAQILTFENKNGYSYQYSDFTGNLLINAVSEAPYSVDTIHPEVTHPTLFIIASAASQNNQGHQDFNSSCYYPWQETIINFPSDVNENTSIVRGYDDLTVSFLVTADPGSFIIKNWSLSSNDYQDTVFSSVDNTGYSSNISQYNTKYNLTYTYKDPSLYGIYYLPDGISPITNGKQYQTPDYRRPEGYFNAAAVITSLDLYSCQVSYSYAFSNIFVLERWPEPKFFINMQDSTEFRENFFNN